jgi:hypothetical protein
MPVQTSDQPFLFRSCPLNIWIESLPRFILGFFVELAVKVGNIRVLEGILGIYGAPIAGLVYLGWRIRPGVDIVFGFGRHGQESDDQAGYTISDCRE